MDRLVESLVQAKDNRQIQDDDEFARLIGIDPSTWCMIKSGKRRIGTKALAMIIANLPELTKEAMNYMKERGAKQPA